MQWQKLLSPTALAALEQTALGEIAHTPTVPGCWIALISIQKRMGRIGEARTNLDRAVEALSGGAQRRHDLLDMFLALGEHGRALSLAEALVVEAPDDVGLQDKLRRALTGSDRWETAQQSAFALLPNGIPLDLSLNQSWRLAENDADFRAIAERCRTRLADNAIDTDARCFLAHALARLGEDDAARNVMALDRLARVAPLPTPAGYPSTEEFCRTLAGEIADNQTLERDPTDKATRDGLQTASLGQSGEKAVATLIAQIKVAVADYVRALAEYDDPAITAAPDTVRINQWAVVYDGSGYQTSHRHPSGWISGVYYVVAPSDPNQGALLLGAPQQKVASPPPWGIQRIAPVPGRLVLFPSFVPHATEPCGKDGERICVAFDVMAATGP
ncbi:MAG: putative 2OG-Fe(II) oxygenase [Sphingomonas sp.]